MLKDIHEIPTDCNNVCHISNILLTFHGESNNWQSNHPVRNFNNKECLSSDGMTETGGQGSFMLHWFASKTVHCQYHQHRQDKEVSLALPMIWLCFYNFAFQKQIERKWFHSTYQSGRETALGMRTEMDFLPDQGLQKEPISVGAASMKTVFSCKHR